MYNSPQAFVARSVSPQRLQQASIHGIFLIVLATALSYGQSVIVPIVAALITGFLLGPLQQRLERAVPSPLAAGILVILFLAAALGVLRLMIIPLEIWVDRLPEIWLALKTQLENLRTLVLAVQDAAEAVEESAGIEDQPDAVTIDAPNLLGTLAIGLPSLTAQFVLFFCVLFFFLAARTRLRIGLLSLCVNRRMRLKVARLIQDWETHVSTYLGTIAAINVGLGLATAAVFYFIGAPNPMFWGAMAAMLNFIPYIGPAALTVVLIGVGLLSDETGMVAYLPALSFFILNAIEANIVTPSVLGKSLTIEPLLVIVSLAFWLWLWGPIGALLAVPLMLVIQAAVVRLIR